MPVNKEMQLFQGGQRGSTMVETVVALFILAIGLLAVQAMQLSSLRTNVSSSLRTDAQFLADDMIDRLMAYDNQSLLQGNQAITAHDFDGLDTNAGATDPGCSATGCGLAQQRNLDGFQWKSEVEARLPGGRGSVTSDGDLLTVTVMWDSDKTGANGTGCSGNSDVDLTCYIVQIDL